MAQTPEMSSRPHRPRRKLSRPTPAYSSSTFYHSVVISPRTLCPRDTDAFSYNPLHLRVWHMPEDLWNAMPPDMQNYLVGMQHAGAAVYTGFERLDELFDDLLGKAEEDFDEDEDDYLAYRHMTLSCSAGATARTPSLTSLSSFSTSQAASDFTNSSPENCPQTPGSPVSPFALSSSLLEQLNGHSKKSRGEADAGTGLRLCRQSESTSSFQRPPRDHRIAQWRAEVNYMRQDSLVRLRHAIRKVEGEWRVLKKMEGFAAKDCDVETCNLLATRFQAWLDDKIELASHLEVRGKSLGATVNLGWSGGSPYCRSSITERA